MNVLLDIFGSTIFVGILIITILTVNNNIVMSNYKSISTYEIQTQAVQLGRILEYDIYKMGYSISNPSLRVLGADTSYLQFKADLADNGTINTVTYQLGNSISTTINPRDKQLSRVVDGTTLFISYNATKFFLTYYDSAMTKLATPLSAANLLKVRTIKVKLQLETPDPVDVILRTNPNRTDSLYTGAYYEKLITARNLGY
jgi:hypothetical protein